MSSTRVDSIELADIRAFAGATAKDGVMLKGPVALVCTVLVRAHQSGVRGVPPRLPPGFLPTSRKLPKAPSAAELQKMLGEARGWLGTAIALAGFAGLRMGEVRALEVRDIDFEENSIVVRRALSGEESLTTKSGHDRIVPMIPELKARLEQAVKGKFPKSRVVLNDKGATPSRQYTLTVFQRFLKQAGIKEWSFHALRHFFISELVRRGAGLEAVRLLAGHSKLEMTQRYAHATGDDLRAAISKLRR